MPSELLTRLGLLLLVGSLTWLLVWVARRFVEAQRSRALAVSTLATPDSGTALRILAFGSADCQQCHRLQDPALQRVTEARGELVSVEHIDATTEQSLVQTYRVMTVPSTVLLDANGHTHAVNYGFANTQRLLTQIDAALAQQAVQTSVA